MTSATGKGPGRQWRAITLIELALVILVIGILIGVALPSFRKTFNQLQLNSFSRELQVLMDYLRQRSIIEGKIIYLNIDSDNRQYWTKIRDAENRLKTYRLPEGVTLESEKKQVAFYPDGNIDKTTIIILGPDNKNITLTTIGVFGGVKLKAQE